ncbi:MAG: hypothetical protein RJA70_221 [Pseudomonadota bacterium]|jgi:superfamily II RNA helicase
MASTDPVTLADRLPLPGRAPAEEELLEAFMAYTESLGLELYPAQEEAILELCSGNNVILNTPTGSGKSLVALAACFKALSDRGFAFYTAPIKALVTEKFFELCKVLGADNVGMMTGDASVNVKAPIICCTAEILSLLALREGKNAQADWVIMDEFHYYSDKDRGSAWQVPLLTLPQARFLLMSATLGETDFFLQALKKLTGAPSVLVKATERPVPLDFVYAEVPLQQQIAKLVESSSTPVYIVHFSQRAASEQAQNLMSLNFCTKEEKQLIKEELVGFRFDSPFGKELTRFVRHGVGVHHAGMLPKYRRLCERLAQKGLLRVICGTDTLGVGVNVPIRTVLFTQLCKFDGSGTTLLTVRDFHQISGRAGRRGFDTQGTVVVQAPEHEIENARLRSKADGDPKKMRKIRMRPAPERGYKPWNAATLETLQRSAPEPLVSRFEINHGMLLNVLAGEDGCHRARQLIRDCHEPPRRKRQLLRQGIGLLRSLIGANIISGEGGRAIVNSDLQQDFSLNQALSLYALQTIESLDREAKDYAMVLLSVVEATLESPAAILSKQVDWLKGKKVAELKAAGVEYEERMEELAKIEHTKPEAEFLYATYNLFAKHHPWVAGDNISPKSIVRDMHEQAASFNQYVKEYGLARAEGVLLRYLTDAYRVLRQTVPENSKTEEVIDLEEWLGAELRSVDASLLEEWERLQLGDESTPLRLDEEKEAPTQDITRNARAFHILVKNAAWRVVQAIAGSAYERTIGLLLDLAADDADYPRDPDLELWNPTRLAEILAPYWERHTSIALDADARSAARVQVDTSHPKRWQVRQILSDPAEEYDFTLEFEVDLEASRADNSLRMSLRGLHAG